MSSKTTGPLSTNPPAVMGRFSSSYTGAAATPADMPLLIPPCWGFAGAGGASCARTSHEIETITTTTPHNRPRIGNENTPYGFECSVPVRPLPLAMLRVEGYNSGGTKKEPFIRAIRIAEAGP